MSRIATIQTLVRNGLYYLTEHANEEANEDGYDIHDIEHAILSGKIRRTWPRECKYEIVGPSPGGQRMGIVCRITSAGKVRVITVYRDKPRH